MPHPAPPPRGKWMDGWETRRRREPGYDWCVVRLGMPGVIHGVVIDTAWFRGNYPAEASLEGCELDDPRDLRALATATWTELLPKSALAGDSKNRFAIAHRGRITHLRLNIFPDGGVARLRVHGDVTPRPAQLAGTIDLAALENGGWVESCSDMFFGSRNNLIKPGPSRTMADGWETRRRRGPGHDWALIRLAHAGAIERLGIDTSHFKGNAPGRCLVEGLLAAGASGDGEPLWRPMLSSPLQPHTSLGLVAYVMAMYADGVYALVEEASAFGSSGLFVVVFMGLFVKKGSGLSAILALSGGLISWIVGAYWLELRHPYLISVWVAFLAYLAGIGLSQWGRKNR